MLCWDGAFASTVGRRQSLQSVMPAQRRSGDDARARGRVSWDFGKHCTATHPLPGPDSARRWVACVSHELRPDILCQSIQVQIYLLNPLSFSGPLIFAGARLADYPGLAVAGSTFHVLPAAATAATAATAAANGSTADGGAQDTGWDGGGDVLDPTALFEVPRRPRRSRSRSRQPQPQPPAASLTRSRLRARS